MEERIFSKRWFALVVIVLLTVIIYSNVYGVPFLLDDISSIKENALIRDLSHYFSLKHLLMPRKVGHFTFALNYHFNGFNVFGYHVVNILIHIMNGILVYFLSLALLRHIVAVDRRTDNASSGIKKEKGTAKKSRKKHRDASFEGNPPGASDPSRLIPVISLVAALIFIAHPLQTQAVTYIVQRYTSLAAFFYMASVLSYVKARDTMHPPLSENPRTLGIPFQAIVFFTLSFAAGLCAFMVKENTASLPGAIVLVEYMCFGGTAKQWAKRTLVFLPIIVLFVVFVLYVSGVMRGANMGTLLESMSARSRETELVSRWSYLCTQFNVIVIYLRLLVCPVNQNLDYAYRFNTSFFNGLTPFAFALLFFLIIGAVWARKRYPVITVAVFWFFITLSVESSIIPIRDAIFEHRLYLPLFGFAFFAAWFLFHLFRERRPWAIVLSVVIIASLSTATYLRNEIWQDRETLWRDVLKKSPANPRAYFSLGIVYEKTGDSQKAIHYYGKTLDIAPDHAHAHYNLGNVFRVQGDLEKAAYHYGEALRVIPDDIKARGNLAVTLFRQGDFNGALEHFREVLRIDRKNVTALINLGKVLEITGDRDEAMKCYRKVLKLSPDHPEISARLKRLSDGKDR